MNPDSTTTHYNTEISRKDTDQKKIKSGTQPKASTMQPAQSESSTNITQTSPDWEKVEKLDPVPLRPQDEWGDLSGTCGPFVLTSHGYSGAGDDELEERQKEAKRIMEHAGMF